MLEKQIDHLKDLSNLAGELKERTEDSRAIAELESV
jgi:hypothetical protein